MKIRTMKPHILTLLLLFFIVSANGQAYDTIKIKLVAGQEVIPGANIVIKDLLPITGTNTDLDGVAVLVIPSDKNLVEISFIGPFVRLKIERPADSIYFDINSKKGNFLSG